MTLRSRRGSSAAGGVLGAAALLWVFHGCSGGQSGAEVVAPGGDDPGGGGTGGGDNPGASECTENGECAGAVQDDLDALSQPRPVDVVATGSRCEQYNVILETGTVSGNACVCEQGDSTSRTVGPDGVGCYVTGRGGDCLFEDGEFSGCDVSAAGSCESVCAELEARMEADAARSFAVELVHAACEDGGCESVVSIDGRCFANRDYTPARSYDCSLGVGAILEAHREGTAPPDPAELIPDAQSAYAAGTSGFIELGVQREWFGSAEQPPSFGAYAQFFEPIEGQSGSYGEVLDPLEGVDDCGMVRLGGLGVGADVRMQNVASATLIDGDMEHALEEFRSSAAGYYSYSADLLGAGSAPRYGESYAFRASGGAFATSVELDDIVLPQALAFPGLQAVSRLPRGDVALTWTGSGQAPLRLAFSILPRPEAYDDAYELECLVADDGEFTLSAEQLAAAPDGFVLLGATRERRQIQQSAGKALQTIASVRVYHRFWLGPACDGAAVMAACQASAARIDAEYAECSVPPLALETRCPDYLLESCGACVEYFECLASATSCSEDGLMTSFGCGCP